MQKRISLENTNGNNFPDALHKFVATLALNETSYHSFYLSVKKN